MEIALKDLFRKSDRKKWPAPFVKEMMKLSILSKVSRMKDAVQFQHPRKHSESILRP